MRIGKVAQMAEQDPIKHVVLLIMENHSFDQMLGCLQAIYPELDGVDIDAIDPRFNVDSTGNKVFQIPTDEQQVPLDPKHENRFVLDQIANHNSGFVIDFEMNVPETQPIDRQYVMGYYLLDRLPALHELARNFTVCDRWFSSLPGPTWPNRFFVHSGTCKGHVKMPSGIFDANWHCYDQPTLYDRLSEQRISWKIYHDGEAQTLVMVHQLVHFEHYHEMDKFFADADDDA